MNKLPSQRVNVLVTGVEDHTIPFHDIMGHLREMQRQFEKEEAAAYRGLQAVNHYYGVEVIEQLMTKSNELTGR